MQPLQWLHLVTAQRANELEVEISKLKDERNNLASDKEILGVEVYDLKAKYDKLLRVAKRARKSVAELNERVIDMQHQRDDAKGHARDSKAVWKEAYGGLQRKYDALLLNHNENVSKWSIDAVAVTTLIPKLEEAAGSRSRLATVYNELCEEHGRVQKAHHKYMELSHDEINHLKSDLAAAINDKVKAECDLGLAEDEIERLKAESDKWRTQAGDLHTEIERLMGLFANAELLNATVNERCAEVSMKPREEIMRYLLCLCANAIGDAKNYFTCDFGPDKDGYSYEVTVRYREGKTPNQVHDERMAAKDAVIKLLTESRDHYRDMTAQLMHANQCLREDNGQIAEKDSELAKVVLKADAEYMRLSFVIAEKNAEVEMLKREIRDRNLNSTTDAL